MGKNVWVEIRTGKTRGFLPWAWSPSTPPCPPSPVGSLCCCSFLGFLLLWHCCLWPVLETVSPSSITSLDGSDAPWIWVTWKEPYERHHMVYVESYMKLKDLNSFPDLKIYGSESYGNMCSLTMKLERHSGKRFAINLSSPVNGCGSIHSKPWRKMAEKRVLTTGIYLC